MFSGELSFFDESEKIWYGPKEKAPSLNMDCSIGCVMYKMMQLKPKAVALVSDTESSSVTYAELCRDSVRIALHLRKLVPNRENIIGIVAGQTMLSTHVQVACLLNTNVFHPVNPERKLVELEHLYAKTRPKLIFCDGRYYAKVLSACKALQLVTTIYTIDNHIEGVASITELMQPILGEERFQPTELVDGGSQTVLILNSSGTTDLPKAICYSNNALAFGNFLISENTSIFVFSPLDWLTSFYFTVISINACATRVLTQTPYSPEYLVHLIEKYKINFVQLPPSYIETLMKWNGVEEANFSSIRIIFCAGGRLSPLAYSKFRKLLKDERKQMFVCGYGSTELGSTITLNFTMEKPKSVGKLKAGFKVRIINEYGQNLGVGEAGEILAFTGKKWNGYYGDMAKTKSLLDANNWYHTGDLGYFDEDGDLFIIGRKVDIVKYRGIQYSPHEIEDVIAQLPDVLEVCVFGNTKDTALYCPAAAVVRRAGSQLTEEQVIEHVNASVTEEWNRLSGGVYFLKMLPKTGTGKVIRRETQKLVLGKGKL